ncbi:AAA family ATPase [Actinomadura luteofluorescens]|uniref:AAA+ superfamily predicted ATPase n=1 Tax=Actinomadura luteofluorescens TaxID=46163 RepID=A0A7Y9EQ42_9ACTN|nr:AAA family ATPase [Actinomadura luteofluorescens]NYD51854.1 AAA+ superfamily predicted ATPase [Actinomadura luteofluorescens]
MTSQDDLFHPVIELPEPTRRARYDRLVGLDDTKLRLRKEAALLADPHRLQAWAAAYHGGDVAALTLFADRAPLFIFGGDVGSGKSALAESFGCDLADFLELPVYLYRLKLATRGSGLVGEMTSLIGDAFTHMHMMGKRVSDPRGVRAVQILVVDEADALVQSREAQQMHHEDRAGVDAFLAGIDGLAGARLPVVVVLCTNRLVALDPAIMRRAAATFTFSRPNDEQRYEVLSQALDGLGIRPETVRKVVELTGPNGDQPGYTFSDLTQRLVPAAVFRAFPDRPVTDEDLLALAEELEPTPVFTERR